MEFLIDLGLLELMAPLTARGDAASLGRLQALKNLLLPPMMGERMKVSAPAKSDAPHRSARLQENRILTYRFKEIPSVVPSESALI